MRESEHKKIYYKKIFLFILSIIFIACVIAILYLIVGKTPAEKLYQEKEAFLAQEVFSDEDVNTFIENKEKFIVFFSLCNGQERALVFTGIGDTLQNAWDQADATTSKYVRANDYDTYWLKVDIVDKELIVPYPDFTYMVADCRNEFFRWGISFDLNYQTALLEAELNGNKIIDYENDTVDMTYLNNYLDKSGRSQVDELSEVLTLFQCKGWICDENRDVYSLYSEGLDYGRRIIENIDQDYVESLIINASSYLINQVNDDGSFVYGVYPRFDNEIENYNIMRHASTIWSLICQYKLTGNEALIPKIDSTIEYMVDNAIIYANDNTAYLWEEKSDEIKVGGLGVAIVALYEYMEVFENDKYTDLAIALGNGILTMMDTSSGTYYHVWNGDLSEKEDFRTVYYDGEATFALAELYSLTGEQKWLDAAIAAVDHFIAADYTLYKDHWVAYAMNEITKYVKDDRYYEFALRNAQENLDDIYYRDTTYHTYLELLMVTFELYNRMMEQGIHIDYLDNEFDLPYFLETIYSRVDHMLNGYFYPEYAMYMENPQSILYTFMVRHDGYRVRIDDVQHNIGGYYLYYLYYDDMVNYWEQIEEK